MLAVAGVRTPGQLGSAFADPTVWLLAGSFVIAAATGATGLAGRLAASVSARAGTVQGLCWGLTAALGATAFVIPSTSGRAALAVPIFLALAAAIDDRRVVRALALLFPATILLSAIASLIGAGAHLVTAGLVERGIPTIALAGTVGEAPGANYDAGITAFSSIRRGPVELEQAMEDAPQMLRHTAESVMRMVAIGTRLYAAPGAPAPAILP